MKILWITNMEVGELYEHLYDKKSNGLWIDALLHEFINENEHELVIATTGKVRKMYFYKSKKIKYYLLPGGSPLVYNHKKNRNLHEWKLLIDEEKPDIIQIWGSEFKHGLAALKASPNTPAVVYIQGILDSIYRYYEAGLEHSDITRNITFRDIVRNDSIIAQKKKYYKRAVYEKEMLELAGNVISENLWCDTHCKGIAPKVTSYHCPLSINDEYLKHSWNLDKIDRHTVMCNASGYPLKGLHIILKAIHLVCRKYPNVKLYVPGTELISDGSFGCLVRKPGYKKIIEKLIRKLQLKNNVIFTGILPAEQMGDRMSNVNCFVMGSSIENHSSTLKEAMFVGVPCISSIVGGIPEYVTHNENGLLYRFEEYEMLAEYICKIFENDEFAQRLSNKAKATILSKHSCDNIYGNILEIYNNIIERK